MSQSLLFRRLGFVALGLILIGLVGLTTGCILAGTKYAATYQVQWERQEGGPRKQAEQLVSIITNKIGFPVRYSETIMAGNEQSFTMGIEPSAARRNDLPSIFINGRGGSSLVVLIVKAGPKKTEAMVNARKVVEEALNSFAKTEWKVHVTRHERL
jgi:hypothetical protein